MEVVLLRLTGQVHGVQLLKAFEEVPAPEGLTPDSRRHHDAINRYLRSRAQIAAALLVRMKTSDSPH